MAGGALSAEQVRVSVSPLKATRPRTRPSSVNWGGIAAGRGGEGDGEGNDGTGEQRDNANG